MLEPVSEALVQLRPRRLGQGVVRGVSDQQVAEAERVVFQPSCACVGVDQAFPDERGEAWRYRAVVGQGLDRSPVEDLTFHRASIER